MRKMNLFLHSFLVSFGLFSPFAQLKQPAVIVSQKKKTDQNRTKNLNEQNLNRLREIELFFH